MNEHYMTVNKLKTLVDKAVAYGYGDAVVMVQANTDNISDIIITDFEGCGNEFGDGPLVFSLESNYYEPEEESEKIE